MLFTCCLNNKYQETTIHYKTILLQTMLIFLLTNRQIMEYIPMLTRCLITTRPNDLTCLFGVVMVRITTWNSWWSLSKRTPSQTSPTCQVKLLSEAGERIDSSLFSFSNIKKLHSFNELIRMKNICCRAY